MKRYEVLVVGAGPAGCTAARQCAKAGLSTLLLEKEKIPREKRCAGGVSFAALKELDFELPEEIIERRCIGMRAVQGEIQNEVRDTSCVANMVTRSIFDEFLAGKAKESGAEIKEEEACTGVEENRDHVTVTTNKSQYRANIVIGADGVFSVVARAVRPAFTDKELRFCLIADVPLGKTRVDELSGNLVELHYGYIEMGYAWLFPKRDYISFGLGGNFTAAKGLKDRFSSFLELFGINAAGEYKGCFIPITRFKHDLHTDRLMLAGDAAGFVDCFSGEGIHLAVAAGKRAARTAAAAHNENSFSKQVLHEYQDQFYKEFKADLQWSRWFSSLLFRFPGLILGNLIIRDEVILNYFKVMSGEKHFKDFALWALARLPYYLLRSGDRKKYRHAPPETGAAVPWV